MARQSLISAFKCAFAGIGQTIVKERNIKIHLCVALLAIILGFVFSISSAEWLAVVICIGVVLSLEVLNSAVEAVVDICSPGYNELARIAKDCAAGAVLVCAIASVVVAAIIFLPKILGLFFV